MRRLRTVYRGVCPVSSSAAGANDYRGVSAMFRKCIFLKSGRYLFISILFAGICHHPDNAYILRQAGVFYG